MSADEAQPQVRPALVIKADIGDVERLIDEALAQNETVNEALDRIDLEIAGLSEMEEGLAKTSRLNDIPGEVRAAHAEGERITELLMRLHRRRDELKAELERSNGS
jgi:hypothetical protein